MRRSIGIVVPLLVIGVAVALLVGPWTKEAVVAADGERVTILDDCDPSDPLWAPQGCALREGDVTRAQFNAQLASPRSAAVVGHPSWRNEPSYLTIEPDESVRVRNRGGRGHTFTKVAAFGGGFVLPAGPAPGLNFGLTTAPECPPAAATVLPPGARTEVSGSALSVGENRFQCCIHPWMRAVINVKAEDDD